MQNVLIVTPSITEYDAVSTDVWQQQRFLQQCGLQAHVYAEFSSDALNHRLIPKAQAWQLARSESTTMVYHHSVYWELGQRLVDEARCEKILRYHNITPVQFFSDYDDRNGTYATRMGLQQTQALVRTGGFKKFWGASQFNCDELIAMGAQPTNCQVLAPLHAAGDIAAAGVDAQVASSFNNEDLNVLFVGRVSPNKGHLHLIRTIDAYVDRYDPNIRLHIVGNVKWAPPKYLREIKALVKEKQLGQQIKFWGSLDTDGLHTSYQSGDAFLLMSEHEGFCVPIIEAQQHRLPIVALASSAVPETLGSDQICIPELDYDRFAAALRVIKKNSDVREFIVEKGWKNQTDYKLSVLQTKLSEALDLSLS